MKQSHDVVLSRMVRTGFSLALVVFAIPALAETCGIDTIFANGFEVPGAVSLGNAPGALQSPGITQSIIGSGTFSVAISYPAPAATVPGLTTAVAGVSADLPIPVSSSTASGLTSRGISSSHRQSRLPPAVLR